MLLSKIHLTNSFLYLLLTICAATIVGLSIGYLQTKFIAVLILLPVISIFWLNSTPIFRIALTLLTITFPITLQFLGKDAMTTGTLLIFVLFTQTWVSLEKKTLFEPNSRVIFKTILALIFISIAGMLTKTPSGYYGPAVRHLINFISSILLFLIISLSVYLPQIKFNMHEYIDKVLSVLVCILSMHIILSIFFYFYPDSQNYFKIFFHRNQNHLGAAMHLTESGGFERATSIFTGGEELGELLAVMFPFYLYKSLTNKKFITLLPIFAIGLFLSATRSAVILVVIELFIYFYLSRSRQFTRKKIATGLIFIVIVALFGNYIFSMLDVFINRFAETTVNIKTETNFATLLNRQTVWESAWNITWSTLSLVGHGPIQAFEIGKGYLNFHCLYLTLIFQYGISGAFLFCYLFTSLIKRLYIQLRNSDIKDSSYLLAGSSLLSLIFFLINEIKFEFNRGDSYQQFIWAIFAVYYLTGRLWKNHKVEK